MSAGSPMDISHDDNTCMAGYLITFSNLSATLTAELTTMVESMSGKVSAHLLKSVTHLVSDCWTTGKCEYARKAKMPMVMSIEWVEHCFRNGASQSINHEKFRLPMFTGFTICISHVSVFSLTYGLYIYMLCFFSYPKH